MSQSRLVAKNVLTSLATQLLTWTMAIAVTRFMPAYLGDARLGQLSLAGSVTSIFGVFISLGTTTVMVKDVARDRQQLGELLAGSLLIRIPMSVIMAVLAILTSYLLGYEPETRRLIFIGAAGMMIATLNDLLSASLQGQENLTRTNFATLIDKFLSSGLIIALVILRAPLWAFVTISLFTGSIVFFVNLSAFRALLPTLQWPRNETIAYLVKSGMPFLGLIIFFTMFSQTDPIIIRLVAHNAHVGNANIGWYAASLRILGTAMFFPAAIAGSVMPTLARLYRENIDDFNLLARRTFSLIMLCAMPVAAVLFFLPTQLIALMHYPKQFSHSIPLLQIGSLTVLLWYITSYIGPLATACDQQKEIFKASVLAFLVGLPVCYVGALLTFHLWKNAAIGALASDTLMELYLLFIYVRALPQNTLSTESWHQIGRYALASVPTLIIFFLASQLHFGLWVLLPCMLIYLGMCWVLKCLGPGDVAVLRNLLVRKVTA